MTETHERNVELDPASRHLEAQRQAVKAHIRHLLVDAVMRSADATSDPKLARLPGDDPRTGR